MLIILNSQINKIQAITPDTLIVGVDISTQWIQFIKFKGIEVFYLLNICKNRIHAFVDEYFQNFKSVY